MRPRSRSAPKSEPRRHEPSSGVNRRQRSLSDPVFSAPKRRARPYREPGFPRWGVSLQADCPSGPCLTVARRGSRGLRCGARAPRVGESRSICLVGERLRLEILFAVQQILFDGGYVWEETRRLQWLVDALAQWRRRVAVGGSVGGRPDGGCSLPAAARAGRAAAGRPGRRARTGRVAARDVAPDAGGRTVDYTAIRQRWPRERGG